MLFSNINVAREFKKYVTPVNTTGVIWAHSLNVTGNPNDNLKKLVNLIGTENEICVTLKGQIDQMNSKYANVGVYVTGICTLISVDDTGSSVIDGERFPGNSDRVYDYCKDYKNILTRRHYNEAFVKRIQIIGIWINEYYSCSYESIQEWAQTHNIPVYFVKSRTRKEEEILIEENRRRYDKEKYSYNDRNLYKRR